jgi:hypothetical protein
MLECYISQGWKGLPEANTKLLGTFVSYDESSVVNMAPRYIFTTLHFNCNL